MSTPVCEYCGCQQIDTIAELYREHDEVAAHVGELRSSLAGGRLDEVARSCQQILAILGPHTVVEEEGLFPEMSEEFPDHIEALRADHREIEKVLGEAAEGPPADPTWPDRLLHALLLLSDHILKEQDGVFPAALIALDPDQWERIEAVRVQNVAYSDTSSMKVKDRE
ncbi:MAG TPA: hemerythrin domain-containing protein [Dermatophilaceae bacterium]|nr:hemerythrin domain-containing protein [Dermatophilaceae bacterium]